MLISFEGIDGCGKSTQIQLLKDYFDKKGKQVVVFREPGGSAISEQIRSILLSSDADIHPVSELLLFSAARAQLISEKVEPALKESKIVILDRFYDSTTAYQGFGRESVPTEKIQAINAIASLGNTPDLTFYLKISWEESKKRTAHLEEDRMEKAGKDFFERVISGYDFLSKSEERFIEIDASQSINAIHETILMNLPQG
ncbi:MAG: dTMP kinase [Balneolaceae bacterium]|nr:dTMP kinase [Balneolaceae bacterium]